MHEARHDDPVLTGEPQKLWCIAAMAPPGGARAALDRRFTSLFNIFHVVSPSNESLHHIFNTILGNHTKNFSDDIQHVFRTVTDATISFYTDIVAKMPPTPSKFHYLFNLRDLSRIFEGLCKSTPTKFNALGPFVRLWRNECLRVFHDRLTNLDDRNWVMNKLETLIDINFSSVRDEACKNPSIFGDFIAEAGDRLFLYKDVQDYPKLYEHFAEILEDYSLAKKIKNSIVLFDYVIEHLSRILRIIKTPRGNALLIGIGGSGKKSLTRLAAYAAGYEVFEITLTRTYNESDFRKDLKKLSQLVGVERKQVVFLFADSHMMHEGFLELVNNMLTSGVVPALFSPEDKEGITPNVTDEVRVCLRRQRIAGVSSLIDAATTCTLSFVSPRPATICAAAVEISQGSSITPSLIGEALSAVSKHFLFLNARRRATTWRTAGRWRNRRRFRNTLLFFNSRRRATT
jgi:dynein heavy chain